MAHRNPVAPTTTLSINGVEYELLFDLDSVALAEDITDRPLLTGLRQKDISTPTVSLVRAMLFSCLQAKHPEITFPLAKTFVTRKNWSEIWSTVLNAWTVGLAEPDPEEDAAAADPKQDQSAATPTVG
jgi:hypothetical protein